MNRSGSDVFLPTVFGCHAHACRGHENRRRTPQHAHGERGHGTRAKIRQAGRTHHKPKNHPHVAFGHHQRSVAVGSGLNECGRAGKIFEYCSVWAEKSAKRPRLSPCRPYINHPLLLKAGMLRFCARQLLYESRNSFYKRHLGPDRQWSKSGKMPLLQTTFMNNPG